MTLTMRYFLLISFILLAFPLISQDQLTKRSVVRLFDKGLELYNKGEYAAARESFEDFLDVAGQGLKREDALYYRALSAVNLFHEDSEDLVLDFIDKYPYHPRTVKAIYVLGNQYFREGNYDKAVEYYDKVDISALNSDERDEIRFKAGYAYFSQRKFDDALTYFNQLKRHSRKYASASSYYAGFIEFEQGDYDQAYDDLIRAEQSDAYASVVPYMIANILYRQNRYERLLEYINEAEMRPNLAQKSDLMLLKAEAYYSLGKYDLAAVAYENYAEARRGSINDEISFRLGRSLYGAKAYAKAIDPLKKAAISRDSIAGPAAYFLGLAYLKEDRKNEALTAFDQSVRLNESADLKEKSLFHYAKVSLDLDQTRQAIRSFEDYLDKYPNADNSEEASELLSQAYLYTDDYGLALKYLSGRKSLTPQMEKVYQQASFRQAVEYFNANRYAQAVDLFKKSLQYPRDVETEAKSRLWLAEAYSIEQNYDEAIDQYLRVLGNRRVNEKSTIQQARYGLGYAYYNTRQYNNALVNFKSYVSEGSPGDSDNYRDAMLRLADSYYATKAYNQAISTYDNFLSLSGGTDKDYAYLQKGIVAGIAGDYPQATIAFDQVLKNYSSSRYYDDAIFQKAQLNLEEGRYQAATDGFGKLIREKPDSRLIPYALLRRASAHYNLKNYRQSKDDYVTILDEYINHSTARQVLLPLQEVLNILGESGQFDRYLAQYKLAHPDKEGLEAVEYETAKNMYFNQDYEKAVQTLQDFIASYPNDPRIPEAKFYLAESYYRRDDLKEAEELYQQLINVRDFGQRNRIVTRLADINFRFNNYESAVTYYSLLADNAANKKELYNGLSGLMESHFLMGNYDETINYSDQIMEKALVNAGAKNKALLFKGKSYKAKGQFDQAKDMFNQAIENARDISAAEAGYLFGDILYQQQNYEESIEYLINFGKDFSTYTDWVGEAYLLIADNYIALEDYFQAKGTLQSLVDNFPGEEIKERARRKIQQVEQLQLQEKSIQDSVSDTLEIDIKDIDN